MRKLTAVTVSGNGRKCQAFVMADIINGKAVIPREIMDKMLSAIGIIYRGQTYSIG
jgi:acid stress-induced BolA-like protein IbaG/YrbA